MIRHFPYDLPTIITGRLSTIVEAHTDEFKTDFAIMAAP